MEIQIIHKCSQEEPFLIIKKPASLASAPLKDGDISAFTQAAELFPEVKKVAGKKAVEGGLLHRLDTETEGLLLIASTQEFYNEMAELQKNGGFIKTYEAEVEFDGNLSSECENNKNGWSKLDSSVKEKISAWIEECEKGSSVKPLEITVTSKFRFFGEKNKCVRPVTENSGAAANKKCSPKTYETKIKITKDEKYRAFCKIKEGFRHQVRCHLAWCGFPVCGDKIYNSSNKTKSERMMFFATELEFFDWKFKID